MNLTKRGKIVFGSLFTAIFVASGIVVLPPALSPTQAEAQIKQKQYQERYQERVEAVDQYAVVVRRLMRLRVAFSFLTSRTP